MERTEGQNSDKGNIETGKIKGKTLYTMISDMGYDRKKVAPYVAQALGVCSKEEYNKALNAYKNGTDKNTHMKYNIAMRELVAAKIEKGEKIDLGGLQDKALSGFSSNKQAIIKELVGPGAKYETFSSYMNGLEDGDKKKLNDVSDDGLKFYIIQQAEKGKDIVSNSSNNVNAYPTMEQIANGIQLEKFAKDFETIKANYPNIARSTNENMQIAYEKKSQEEKNALNKIYGNREDIYKAMGLEQDMLIAEKNGLREKMTKEEQQKYDILVKRYYEYNESIGLGEFLKETWGEFYEKVKNMVVEYTEKVTASPMDEVKNEVVQHKDVQSYFDTYMDMQLVSDEEKDLAYYESMRKLYPTLDVSIQEDPQIQELMNIKKPTDKEKEKLQKLMEIKTKKSGAEDDLMKETKKTVEEQAVTSCLDVLKTYMDIDLSTEENVLEQFRRAKSGKNDLIEKKGEDIILNIDGKINGKNLKLYYNLTTGKLEQEVFMKREKINGPFFIKDPKNGKMEIPDIQLPAFDDFIVGAKSLDYKELVENADDVEEYKENVASALKETVKKSGNFNMETEKMRFKRNIMKDMAVQEIFTFMEQNIEAMPNQTFSSTNNAEVYAMLSLIDASLREYGIVQLEVFRKSIQDMGQKKKNYMINLSKAGTNDARYALGLLGQTDHKHTENITMMTKDAQENMGKTIVAQEKNADQPYGYLQTYARFFSIFKNNSYAHPIIEPITLEKFNYQLTQEVSTDQSYLERTDTQLAFNEFIDKSEALPDVENAF